jgi:hypothetical protein
MKNNSDGLMDNVMLQRQILWVKYGGQDIARGKRREEQLRNSLRSTGGREAGSDK